MSFKLAASIIGIGLVIVYAVGSGVWVSNSPGWYSALNRPSWQPPDFVFGLIWPYNFIIIGLSAVHIAQNQSRNMTTIWLATFAISIISALNWAYQFYVPHNLSAASISLVIAAALTLPLTYITYKTSITYGWLFTPYQLWVITAALLSSSYARLN